MTGTALHERFDVGWQAALKSVPAGTRPGLSTVLASVFWWEISCAVSIGVMGFTVQFMAPLEIQKRLITFIASEYIAHSVKDTLVNCTAIGLPVAGNTTLCSMSEKFPDLDDNEGWWLALILGGSIIFVSIMNGQLKIYLNKVRLSNAL
jgi:hypothetical protein